MLFLNQAINLQRNSCFNYEGEKMKTTVITKTVDELTKSEKSPIPLSVIPNYMGINLCSVDKIEWGIQEDNQLVYLTIHFIPKQ